MDITVFGWTVVGMFAAVIVTFAWQWAWAQSEEVKVWKKHSTVRSLPDCYSEVRSPSPVNIKWTKAPKLLQMNPLRVRVRSLPGGEIEAFAWDVERKYWEDEAKNIRQSFLTRTQATADKWRNVFAALLAVFGAVLFIKPNLPQGQSMEPGLYILIISALVLAAQAVAYTGWASAGMPCVLVNVTAVTAFYEQTSHAARSLVRLRVGLFMGALSVVALILAVAILLSS